MDYAPADPWPEHPKACWRDTLDHARARGWSLRTFRGHAWGELRCASGQCTRKVYTSGEGQENVALDVLRLVDRCPHQTGLTGVLDAIEDRLRKASRLVDAAEALAAKGKVQERVEMLDASEALLDEPDAVWNEFGSLVDEEDGHAEAAAAAFADAEEAAVGHSEALDLAEDHVKGIRNDLKAEGPGVRRVRDLKGRTVALRDRIVAVRKL